jgi:hypothetical protein
MNKKILFIVLAVVLVGCQQKSEVDKCMEAMWEHSELRRELSIKSGISEKGALPKFTELDIKLEHRFKCLRANAGKE